MIARSSEPRVVISPAMAATRTDPMLLARIAPERQLRRPITLPIAPDTFTTLRKSLVTEVSYGLPVGALIAPLITSESMLAAVMPPRSMRPVTGM